MSSCPRRYDGRSKKVNGISLYKVFGRDSREILNHVIVLNEAHLRQLLSRYIDYYHHWRTHRSLDMDAPNGRPFQSFEARNVIEIPAVHGLHHYYLPKAA